MIESLVLKNFKCYQNQPFEFSNLTVFCGNNSVGKSTAIQSILLMLQGKFSNKLPFNGHFVSLGSYDDIHNQERKSEDFISMSMKFSGSDYMTWYNNLDVNSKIFIAEVGNAVPDALYNLLESFQYIEAERLGPRDNYANSIEMIHPNWLGTRGEHTSEVLSSIDSSVRFEKIDPSTGEINDCRKHPSVSKPQISSSVNAWMQEISPGFSIESSTEERANISFNSYSHNKLETNLRPSNVGFGLSYALSVVTSLLITPIGGLVIIENPEAHIHPRGQSYLGRLIALSAEAGVQVIIETHSDHIINGIRVNAKLRPSFKPSHFNLYYISQKSIKDETHVDKITLDSAGKLSEWPDGFFDQQAIDMKILVTGKE